MGKHNFTIVKNSDRIAVYFTIIIKINLKSFLYYRDCFYNIFSAWFKFCELAM